MPNPSTRSLLTIVCLFFLTACASGPDSDPSAKVNMHTITHQLDNQVSSKKSDQLFHFYKTWHHTPFRLGGTSRNGIDCSAFTQTAFSQLFHHQIPRTTALQSQVGREIAYKDRRFGDLVFFKTSFRTRHVGIYIDDNSFMHASTSKGVIISRIDSPYWSDAFWQIRRIE
ncbi:hydrolase [Vibrio sp. UCD-FRSSP16_10]|uniref:C40 family peptidase n=1 Tax=unclassified Vibrio TaxID=2614977 RepID=UPI0007FDBE4F|nr:MULTISPECIES: NlpC/P60 family protein [unclassified Vibrio]OBT12166.1 hydrolase [Vibrio sp. UCD-FRSSP16_30]OBT20497.1 hydrolase [Vibrio sp. UCD-FRSSP16_10]